MGTKVKVSLDSDKSLGYGHLLSCCGKFQPVHCGELDIGQWWECVDCRKPLLLVTGRGYFLVGEDVTI